MPATAKPQTSLQDKLRSIDERQLERIFGASGHLATFMASQNRPFEARPEQLEMAQSVASAIRDRAHLLVEAGTGTGKSYAYLVPMILWAMEQKKRVLIATGTKALQQQLVERDLPFLAALFNKSFGQDPKYALCLGTANYLCPRRLGKAQQNGLFASSTEVEQLQQLMQFAGKSDTGRNLDLPFEPLPGLWAQVNRESDLCMNRNCSLYDNSFYWKARREQEKAQILVANHHLLFAHIAAGGNNGGVLPPFDALVIDEAHHAEDVAASYLGLEVSNLGAAKLIELLSNRRTNRTPISHVKWAERGKLESQLNDAANVAREAVGRFFENLQEVVRFEPNRSSSIRMKQPQMLANELNEPLERIETVLKEALKSANRTNDEELLRELEGFHNRCTEMRKSTMAIVAQERAGYVYWAQCSPRQSDGFGPARVPRLSLHGAPIEVAQSLRESVFKPFRPVILTSATLTTGGSFDFLMERLGLAAPLVPPPVDEKEGFKITFGARASSTKPVAKNGISVSKSSSTKENGASSTKPAENVSSTKEPEDDDAFEVRTLTLGSPFDYAKNALVYVAADLPNPKNNVTFWEEAAIKRAAEIVKRTDGRAFILCTSYRMVDATVRLLERVMPARIRILKQGGSARGKLLQEFRDDVHSVLVGTTSFWQGVDVPGESLSCVIITKLPFAVPDDPMVQARVETIKSRGRNAFSEYQVPEAVMMFRQGFGRLIRSSSDRGIVAILDPRVKSESYGKTFLESLPPCEVTEQLERLSLFVSEV